MIFKKPNKEAEPLIDEAEPLIRAHFRETLGREIDERSLKHFLRMIKTDGKSVEEVKKIIEESPEALVKKAVKQAEPLIRAHFRETLGREIDERSLKLFVSVINSGEKSMEEVKKIIEESPEARFKKSTKHLQHAPVFKTTFSDAEIQQMFNSIPIWFHKFKFGNIENSMNIYSLEYQMWASQGIPLDLKDKNVLDIGAADGFYSFLCEQRGAKVLAIDSEQFDERKEQVIGDSRFKICKKIIDSKVEYQKMSVYDLDKIHETFDIVLFFGVYYHLENPILAIQKIFPKVNDVLFVTTHIIETEEPFMYLYEEYEAHPLDHTNWWVPSPQCMLRIGKRMGFQRCEMLDTLLVNSPQQFASKEKYEIGKISKVGLFKFTR